MGTIWTFCHPGEDYCTAHDAWRRYSPDATACENSDEDGDGDDPCSFPDVDSNPPQVRWVPCGTCGAGDGERHSEKCAIIDGQQR